MGENGERSQAENLTLKTDIPTLTLVRHPRRLPRLMRRCCVHES